MEKQTQEEEITAYTRNGFGTVRPYLYGPTGIVHFLKETFGATELESNESGPTALQVGDSLLWIEEGELPEPVKPWTGAVYVYVQDVDAVFDRAIQGGAQKISAPEDKHYQERQAGFTDMAGNTWWISTYQ